jgi:hypothetical protein
MIIDRGYGEIIVDCDGISDDVCYNNGSNIK